MLLSLIGHALFLLGMGGALYADLIADNLESILHVIIKNRVTRNTNLAQHVKHITDKKKKEVTYNLLKYLLIAGFVYNIAYNLLANAEDRAYSIFIILEVFYPWVTWSSTLKDVLLNDDITPWNLRAKQKYISFPVNLVNIEVMGKPVTGDQRVTQIHTAKKALSETSVFGQLAALLLLTKFVPSGAFILWSWYPFLFHENLNKFLNSVGDYVALNEFKNKYDHLFGQFSSVFTNYEVDDKLGMQYEYFARSFKPAAAFFKNHVFKKMRKGKFTVKESLAATYFARGVFFVTLFSLAGLNASGDSTNVIPRAMFPAVYYAIQTMISLSNIEADLMAKSGFFRICYYVVELLLSGFLFYKPLMDAFIGGVFTKPSVFVTSLALLYLEYYNKPKIVENTVDSLLSRMENVVDVKNLKEKASEGMNAIPNMFRVTATNT